MTDSYQQPEPVRPGVPLSPKEDTLWASLAHFGNIIPLVPALVIFAIFRDRGSRVRAESTEALNWTINVTGLFVILSIVVGVPILGLLVVPLNLILSILNTVFAILGGVKVQSGGSYRYPVNYRWIK